ncbi:MAG: hypothetical protein SVT52_02080 [Planctomycetota bacterium]|nr:hypothetical protein [Planctomycetota bacterium]
MNDNNTSQGPDIEAVQCAAAKDPAVRWFIFAAMLIGMGIWCLTDQREPPEAWTFKHINPAAGYVLNNILGPYVFIPAGVLSGLYAILFLRRKLVADAGGIGYADREKIPWSQIKKLDAEKLQSKGFLHLHYGDDKTLTLDSWKLQNFRELVAFVEKHVPPQAQAEGG